MKNKRRKSGYITRTAVIRCAVCVVLIVLCAVSFMIKYAVNNINDEYKTQKEEAVNIIRDGDSGNSSVKEKNTKNDETDSVDLSDLPLKMQELYKNNPDAREYVLGYKEKKNNRYEIDLSDLDYNSQVPLLLQWDERWGYRQYSGDLFGLTGCGPTCMSMALIYLKKDATYDPEWMLEYSERNGYSVEGKGSSWQLVSEGAKMLGLNVRELPLDENVMKNNLSENSIIIAVMGPGDFTTSGHFIVIKSYDDGFEINDPNSFTNSQKKWSYTRLKGQIRNIWALEAE